MVVTNIFKKMNALLLVFCASCLPTSIAIGEACQDAGSCAAPCGRCRDIASCDPLVGVCLTGCQPWWLGMQCDTQIVIPDHTVESSYVLQISTASVMVTWQPLQSLPRVDNTFYHYLISYRQKEDLADEKGPVVDHNPSDTKSYLQAVIPGLRSEGTYQFKVWPFRQNDSDPEYGTPYVAVTYRLDDEDYGDGGDDDGEECDDDTCSPVAWYLFAVSCLVNLALGAFVVYHLLYKKRSRRASGVRTAPDPDRVDDTKYKEPPCTVGSQSPAVVSGEYLEPVQYYRQHIVTPAPYERLDSQFHPYENNSSTYQILSADRPKTESVDSGVQQLIGLYNQKEPIEG